MPQLVLVLGMHRSGTSALTRTLMLAGLEGPRRILQPDQANRRGFWESPDVVFLNDDILRAQGTYWFDPRPLNSVALSTADREDFVAKAEDVLRGNFSLNRDAVLKDPRLCRLGPIWSTAAERAGYTVSCVVMHRAPLEVAASLGARNAISKAHGLELWRTYQLEAERFARDCPATYLNYDQLLDNPSPKIEDMLSMIGRGPLDAEQAREIRAFLNPGERRQRLAESESAEFVASHPQLADLVRCFRGHPTDATQQALNAHYSDWLSDWGTSTIDTAPLTEADILDHPLQYLVDGNRAVREGDEDVGLDLLVQGVKAHPRNYQLRMRVAGLSAKRGDIGVAEDALRQALEISPSRPDSYFALSQLLHELDQRDEALRLAKRAVEIDPSWAAYSSWWHRISDADEY